MAHVFISYSKQNKDYARKLADHLISQGFDVWIDDQIEPSDEWFKRIVKGIRECDAFLVIMSKESGTSRWVEREVMLADELQKPMFPVLLNGDLHTCELWALFIGKQYEDVRGDQLPADRFYAKLALSAPRKTVNSPDDGWTPKFDEITPDAVISDAKIARFTKMHQTFLDEKRAESASQPPDVSHILPPPFEWCVVPTGEVTVRFTPRTKVTSVVPAFSISRYPITNSQYQVFIDARDGYANPAWWGFSDNAKRWWLTKPEPKITAFSGDQLPRTNVTWYEAIAFCNWLIGQIGLRIPSVPANLTYNTRIMLPTEQQWQRAAQGDDGREYPWGNLFSANYCNVVESNVGQPSAVTRYENGESPFEVLDMAGNVWEWCLSEWGTSEINLKSDGERVLRGGAWNCTPQEVAINSRVRRVSEIVGSDTGFRIIYSATA
jgi:formylglycine-generating enzyme required for sulfatase activity